MPVIRSDRELEELDRFWGEEYHPAYKGTSRACLLGRRHDELVNIRFIDNQILETNGIQLYELMNRTDALITDCHRLP